MLYLKIKILSQLNCAQLILYFCYGDGERTILFKRISTLINKDWAERISIQLFSSKSII